MEWEVEELCKLGKNQPEILEEALEELWQRNPALYKSVIINELREKGVPIRGLSKEDVIAEAIREWRKR